MLNHGGGIQQAALTFGLPPKKWLDLSTGINPIGWSIPHIPADKWLRLPEDEDGLLQSASAYYGSENILPVAGSQAAIQVLSRLTEKFRVAVLSPTYSEHAHSWGFIGKKHKKPFYSTPPSHQVEQVTLRELEKKIELYDAVVVVNPNNPTGKIISKEKLFEWRKRQAVADKAFGGERWLIVDEAFMDSTPQLSMIGETGKPGLIVLRSLGKFFGLAGARVGFVFGWPELLDSMRQLLGPWQISGPSRHVAKNCLNDTAWHVETRSQLEEKQKQLHNMLSKYNLTPIGGTTLFKWVKVSRSKELFNKFAQHGILVRRFSDPGGIRFGLPGDKDQWQRLESTLKSISK
ncbi:MAG: threonine-phosphate decarboxylase [Magnetococcales bacterium]|nr:threonine-phosphate decarboxylase [Magnetococcales bacterium]